MRRIRRAVVWATGQPTSTTHLDDAVEAAKKTELRSEIQTAVQKLPQAQREIVVLRFAEEMSVPEIAAIVGCPEGTVKSRLHAALKSLRVKLGGEELFDETPIPAPSINCQEAST